MNTNNINNANKNNISLDRVLEWGQKFEAMAHNSPYSDFKPCEVDSTPDFSKAIKYDVNKPQWSILPFEALEEVVKVFMYGAKKYNKNNFRQGFEASRLVDASLRHIISWNKGIDNDPETNISHLAHATCCLLMLLTNQLEDKMTDDRYFNS